MDPNQQAQWSYHADGAPAADQASSATQPDAAALPQAPQAIVWSAVEQTTHHRGAGWYFMLFVLALVVSGITFAITRSWFSAAVGLLLGVIVAIYAGRPPAQVSYEIDGRRITVGRRSYPFGNFKSFAYFQEGYNIVAILQPLKRTLPPLTLYLDPQQAQLIVNTLGSYLPVETYKPDFAERLAKRLHF